MVNMEDLSIWRGIGSARVFALRFIRDSHGIQCDLKRSLYSNIWSYIILSLNFDTCYLLIGRDLSKQTFRPQSGHTTTGDLWEQTQGTWGTSSLPILATSAICLLPTPVAAAGAGEMELTQRGKLPLFHQGSRLFFPLSQSSEIGSTRPEFFHPFLQFWSYQFSHWEF